MNEASQINSLVAIVGQLLKVQLLGLGVEGNAAVRFGGDPERRYQVLVNPQDGSFYSKDQDGLVTAFIASTQRTYVHGVELPQAQYSPFSTFIPWQVAPLMSARMDIWGAFDSEWTPIEVRELSDGTRQIEFSDQGRTDSRTAYLIIDSGTWLPVSWTTDSLFVRYEDLKVTERVPWVEGE